MKRGQEARALESDRCPGFRSGDADQAVHVRAKSGPAIQAVQFTSVQSLSLVQLFETP